MQAIECILWLIAGMLSGMLLFAYATAKERRESDRRHLEAMRMAADELDEAQKEMKVKQNIIDSLSSKVMRQDKTIKKLNRLLKKND